MNLGDVHVANLMEFMILCLIDVDYAVLISVSMFFYEFALNDRSTHVE